MSTELIAEAMLDLPPGPGKRRSSLAGPGPTRPPCDTFYGGYAGYFTDPDGHAWEIAYNPGFSLADDGSLTLPVFGE